MSQVLEYERLERERAFHNERYEHGDSRESQMKYYWAIREGAEKFGDLVVASSAGRDVLEYGCGNSFLSQRLAQSARSVTCIDISDMVIARAGHANTQPNVRYAVMDAMNMDYADGSFDVVFGSGIIHHLDTDKASREIARVLRPGGKAIFWEPLGLNPAINLYRFLTPSARTPDEHPLLPVDFRIMRRHFSDIKTEYFGLFTLLAVPFRNSGIGRPLFAACLAVDRVLFRIPGIRMLAWYSLYTCHK